MSSERGFSLIEVLISLAIMGLVVVTFLGGLTTASRVTLATDTRETARSLAESQMEHVKKQAYAAEYSPLPIPPENSTYTAFIDVEPIKTDGNIQNITVTIEHGGQAVTSLSCYKVK